MRGKGNWTRRSTTSMRITPAYAGKRYAGCDFGNVQRDHPRLCGEKLLSIFQKSNHLGSPPPMRGKVLPVLRLWHWDRITPAYAGKSFCLVHKKCSMQDHPRLCGEKQLFLNRQRQTKGSPPPMRGKGIIDISIIMIHRITPAYAGKSQIFSFLFPP